MEKKDKQKVLNKQKPELLVIKDIIKKNYLSFFLGLVTIITLVSILISLIKPFEKITLVKKESKKISQSKKSSSAMEEKKYQIYKVQPGDTLWLIAEKFYGSGFNQEEIAKANKIDLNSPIEVGQELIIPKITPQFPTKGEINHNQTEKATFTGNTYQVKEGDYLYKIALEVYGDGDLWPKIAQANKITNADILTPGQKLIIPRQ